MAFVISVPIAVAIPFSMSRFTNGLIIPILYNKTLITNVRFGLYVIIILILYYRTFFANRRLRSLRHKRLSGYAEHVSITHEDTGARGVRWPMRAKLFL